MHARHGRRCSSDLRLRSLLASPSRLTRTRSRCGIKRIDVLVAFLSLGSIPVGSLSLAETEAGRAWADDIGVSEVALARASFEYRDFAKVVDVLSPLLHPIRIVDVDLEVEARQLLGVSLFQLGQTEAASREFEMILRLDPDHALDPFVIPPSVVDAFERIRGVVRPVLEAIRAERSQRAAEEKRPSGPLSVDGSRPVERVLLFLPGGLPQLVVDEPGWATAHLATQLLGLGANVLGYAMAHPRCLSHDATADCVPRAKDERSRGMIVQYSGLALFFASWITSIAQGWSSFEAFEPASTHGTAPRPDDRRPEGNESSRGPTGP